MKKPSVVFVILTLMLAHSTRFFGYSAPAAAAPAAGIAQIAPGSKLFIEPMGGFETYLAAALLKKSVPVVVVDDPAKADFIVSGTSNIEGGAGKAPSQAGASIGIKDAGSGELVFAYAVDKTNAVHGSQSTAEACAKHLKEFIEKNAPGSKAWPQR